MKIHFGRAGHRWVALALLALVTSSCDMANGDGGPADGPGLFGNVPGGPLAGALLQNIRASVGSTVEPNSSSTFVDISADGRFVAFTSTANNLVPGDTNGQQDIFVLDRDFDFDPQDSNVVPDGIYDEPGTLNLFRVSLTDADLPGGAGSCTNPSISPDGRYVAFTSSKILHPDDTNGAIRDIYVRDRGVNFAGNDYADVDGSTILVSRASGAAGVIGNSTSDSPSVSLNGKVVFQSNANNLVAGDGNGTADIFLRDLEDAGLPTVRVSVEVPPAFPGPDGVFDGDNASGPSQQPMISADGNMVSFMSSAADIVNGDGNGRQDFFVRNMSAGTIHGLAAGATVIVSVSSAEAQHFGSITNAQISGDGRFVSFDFASPGAANLDPADGDFSWDVYRRDILNGTTQLVSRDNFGFKGNSDTFCSAISADGNTVFFASFSSNLNPTGGFGWQAYFMTPDTGFLECASVSTNGAVGNSDSAVFFLNGNSISGDGSTAVFPTFANNFGQDVNFQWDIYLRDRSQPLTYRVSALPGAEPLLGCSVNAIAPDAPVVVFVTGANNMIPNATDNLGLVDVFLRDTRTQATRLVSRTLSGGFPNGASTNPSISNDGRFIAFESLASNLVSVDAGGFSDIFLSDLASGEMFVISLDSDGLQATAGSSNPSISSGGNFVAYESFAANLDTLLTDDNLVQDIFVRNVAAGTTIRVSIADDDTTQADQPCSNASLSTDGRFVVFQSNATTLSPLTDLDNSITNIYLRDTQAGTTTLVSRSTTGGEGNGSSTKATISGDGRFIAFESLASNLVAGDVNTFSDIFVFDRTTGTLTRVSLDSVGTEANGASISASIGLDGRYVAFSSAATNLVTPATAGTQVFRKDLQTGTVLLISITDAGIAGNGASTAPTLTGDGRWVAFDTAASNLVQGDTTATSDVVIRGPLN